MTREELLSRIDAFCDENEMLPSTFGRLAMNSNGFVSEVRDGRTPRAATAAKVVQFIDDYENGRDPQALKAISLIKRCGSIGIEADGSPYLEISDQVDRPTFERLRDIGLLEPAGDALFGCPSQTYRLSEAADAPQTA